MTGRASPSLGVCYYPEHWDEGLWQEDAKRMAALGIRHVRIGEFAWSRLEPKRESFDFGWLDKAISILGEARLNVVLGTPTATPPKWLVDEMPDMLPVGKDGSTRKFGSRRHYSFSHQGYIRECAKIVTLLAKRYGENPYVTAWQTDNEYDCHDTALSFSKSDLVAFRNWLAQRYQSPEKLNRAWGNVFWSMEYNSFEQIELPNETVTEANPAHWMDFRRFASDAVIAFNRLQVDILRKYSSDRDIIHNFMGRTLTFDHYRLGADLDVSSWDSYPLGFLEDRIDLGESHKKAYFRAGDPDIQALHHDLYRSTGNGRWWVMEQQPGPVNWAPHNPMPRDGMVRLWSLEAFAHGAEVVSYFRWRQAPFAQEQMHSGLLAPDSREAQGFREAKMVAADLKKLQDLEIDRAETAIVFDYPSAWAWDIQPQGSEFDYFALIFDLYRALRSKGLDVDFVQADGPDIAAELGNRKLVFVPALFSWNKELVKAVSESDAKVIIGPRSGSKTADFQIPENLPPDLPDDLLDVSIERVESLRADCPLLLKDGGQNGAGVKYWREDVLVGESAKIIREFEDGLPALVQQENVYYLSGWPNQAFLLEMADFFAKETGIRIFQLPQGVRTRNAGKYRFFFNYSDSEAELTPIVDDLQTVLGEAVLPPSGVLVTTG